MTDKDAEFEAANKVAWHISGSGMQAGRNYKLFLELMEWAIKNAPSEIKFTYPEVITLEAKLKAQDTLIKEMGKALKRISTEVNLVNKLKHRTLGATIAIEALELYRKFKGEGSNEKR